MNLKALLHPFSLCVILALSAASPALGADKSGVSPNTISVPRGPGSIEGLGESFQPTLNTGTAKYGIPLKLPPGTAGHQPKLSLTYEGGGGNGPLGYGWSLSLPSIQRRTDNGIPTYGEDLGIGRTDTFITESREELVPQTNGFWFCENESAFIRYRQATNHWEAALPNGTRLEFGLTPAARIEEASTSRIFNWLLERETDTRGNVIEYVYRSYPGEENENQKYLAQIRYGPGAPPWTHFHFVALEYEDRPDWFEDCRAGFPIRTGKRLKSITVGTQGPDLPGHLAGDFNGDGTTDHLNRRYDLEYLPYAGTNSHWSLLAKVTLVGADGVTFLPPETFSYAVSDPPDSLSAEGRIWTAINEPASVMDNSLVDLVDLNGDGLPDILRTESGGGAHTAWINRGPAPDGSRAVEWSPASPVDPGNGTAWNLDLASDSTHLADMNGDGLADLVHKTADDTVFYFLNSGQLSWSERREMALQGPAPPAPFDVTGVRTADIDFDKRTDIIQSVDIGGTVAYRTWLNLGGQTYSSPITVESQSESGFDFSTPGVQIADGNGDRVPDLARIRPGAVLLAAGLGYGRFLEPRSLLLPDLTLDDEQIAKAKLTDINGDGLADLLLERAAPGECWFWLNLGNYTLSPRKRIVDLPATFSANTTVRWADLNGNGTIDLIYADSQAASRLQMLEMGELVSGGLTPNLLTRIENGIGRVTRIDYAPSTRFAGEDAAAGNPWPDPVPFPVIVVSSVTVSDSLGHEYRTHFRYHNGYYDPVEKQFRGFARVEQIDVGDPSAPTLVTRSHFDTGRDFDAMKGKLLRSSAETEDGRVFWDETTTWANPPRTLMVGTNDRPVRFAHPVATAKQVVELGRGTPRLVESEFEFDNYGNQTRLANYGIVENGDRSAFNDERILATDYAINLDAWILRLPKQTVVQDENGAAISRSEFFYDDETFSGSNLGSVSVGNLTLRREWIDPANPTNFIASARTRYDAFGNPTAQFDPLFNPAGDSNQGHYREAAYDPGFHSYPIRETIHVGAGKPPLVFEAAYDEGLATMVSSTDFNGNPTTYEYDGLGRLVRFIQPGDAPEFPTAEYEYALAVPAESPSTNGLVNYIETRRLDRAPGTTGAKRDHYLISRQFLDGLGRLLMTRSEAEPAPGQAAPRVIVTGAVLFNARQNPAAVLNPFFTSRSGTLDDLLAFEHIEHPDWRGWFHENGSLVSLDLTAAHKSLTEYDPTLRTVAMTKPDGSVARTEYEPFVVKNFDANDTNPASPHFDTPTIHASDGLGRLIQTDEVVRLNDDGTPSAEPNTWTTHYEYDLNDRLTRITDAQGNVKLMQYDGLKRKILMDDPDSGVSTNIYDAASNLIETIDAKNQRITYTYDGANRLLTEDYHDEASSEFSYHRSPDVVFHYDQPPGPVDAGDGTLVTARNTKGLIAWVEDPSGEEHSSYDARGRVEWTVKRIPDPILQSLVSFRTAFEYDPLDRVTRLTYPDNDEILYTYNARGTLEQIAGGPSGTILSAPDYLPSSQPGRLAFGNGVESTYTYDSRLRLALLHTAHPATGTELIRFGYTLDAASNVRAIDDLRTLLSEDNRRNSQTFAYDDLYRLTQARHPAGETQYRYDRIGNMLAGEQGEMTYGGSSGSRNRAGRRPNDPPGPHALSGVSNLKSQISNLSYDPNGNLTTCGALACTWDFKNRLVGLEDETMRAEYRYDFTGRRISKRVFSKTAPTNAPPLTTLYIDRHFEVRNYDQPTKYVFNGNTRVARITGSLSNNSRVQRIRLHEGWNLISLAVTATNLLAQLKQTAGSPIVDSAYRWDEATLSYVPVDSEEAVPAGAILWVKARIDACIGITGAYSEPGARTVPANGAFLGSAGLEGWFPALAQTAAAWAYEPDAARWRSRLNGDLAVLDELPLVLAPGQALYVFSQSPVEVEPPDPALRIRFYHQDHLGSSSVITDAAGELVEETAFYPFGEPRHQFQPRQIGEEYLFTQKERDQESGLHYFEARYLAAGLSRFMSPDPKLAELDQLPAEEFTACLSRPQKLNLYAYAEGNPVRYNDPAGLDTKETVETVSSWGGFAADVADKSVPGTVFNVVGVTIKTVEFIDDPTEHNAAQAIWEADKWALTAAIPPVGLIAQALDLSGYGPSKIFEATDKSIKAHKAAAKAYRQTAKVYQATTRMINEATPKIEAQLRQAAAGVQKLHEKAAEIRQETADINEQIRQLERQMARDKRELRKLEARIKKLNEE